MQKVSICSLEKIGTPEAISGLVRAAESPDAYIRRAALKALKGINKSNLTPVSGFIETEISDEDSVLRGCLKDGDSEVRIKTSNLSGDIQNMKSLKELELSISVEETEESRVHQSVDSREKKDIGLNCQYCSRNLNLPIAPNFCPFCGMKLRLKCD